MTGAWMQVAPGLDVGLVDVDTDSEQYLRVAFRAEPGVHHVEPGQVAALRQLLDALQLAASVGMRPTDHWAGPGPQREAGRS